MKRIKYIVIAVLALLICSCTDDKKTLTVYPGIGDAYFAFPPELFVNTNYYKSITKADGWQWSADSLTLSNASLLLDGDKKFDIDVYFSQKKGLYKITYNATLENSTQHKEYHDAIFNYFKDLKGEYYIPTAKEVNGCKDYQWYYDCEVDLRNVFYNNQYNIRCNIRPDTVYQF